MFSRLTGEQGDRLRRVLDQVRRRGGRGERQIRPIELQSGTGGEARWIALTDANVLAVLDSHLPVLGLGPAHRLLSTLPWSHAFGLVLECLAALRARASLVRCATPTDAGEHVRLARQWRLDWWCAVPAMVRRLAAEPGGPAVLATLRGGIVGGAALSPAVCALLADTRLRVGYGQTEASPGIMLGEPGEFSPDLLGRPVGCAVRLGPGGAIEFSGPNASPGPRTPSAASLSAPSGGIQWIDTGDLGRREGDAYFFNGRRDDLIRLDNGRTLPARACESALRALHPGAGELMLWSPDGVRLALAFTGPPPSPATLAAALGPLAARTRLLPPVPAGDWRLTVKGETDRPALRHALSTIGQLRIENVSLGIPAIVLPKN